MNTTLDQINTDTKQVSFLYEKVDSKGICEKTKRFIKLGNEVIVPLLRGGVSWGRSHVESRFVQYEVKDGADRREYLQGVEEQEDGSFKIKRFFVSKISNLEVIN